MLLFSLGTVPLMFALGAASSLLSRKWSGRIMHAGAILVVVLGLSMLSNGFSLSGISLPEFSSSADAGGSGSAVQTAVTKENGVQIVRTTLSSGRYQPITVEAGTPVRWTINAPAGSINGCNNRMIIPEYKIELAFKQGDNIVEFTPTKTGRFSYSCWMGMIRSSITVVEPGTANTAPTATAGAAIENDGDKLPAGYDIPTDSIAIAQMKDGMQYVKIDMEAARFQPAIVVVQKFLDTQWDIENKIGTGNGETDVSALLFPVYETVIPLKEGVVSLFLNAEADFEFSADDFSFYGYVKVVDDIQNIDLEAIKKEVGGFETLIWDYTDVASGGGRGCCRNGN
jgi:plastocyanin domain-containing protein